MAFEPNYQDVGIDYKKKLSTAQVVAECKLAPEQGISIAKVLSISANAGIDSFEPLSGEARFGGKVSFSVIFADNEGNNHALDYSASFLDKLSDASITPHIRCFVYATVLDTDTVFVSPSEISLASVVEITVESRVNESVSYLASAQGVYTQDEEIVVSQKVCEVQDDAHVFEEIDPKMNIVKLLTTDSSAIISKVSAGVDTIVVEGKVFSAVCFESEGATLKTVHNTATFVHEISAEGVKSDSMAEAAINLKSTRITLEADVSGERNVIKAEYAIHISAAAYEQKSIAAVVDAFCVQNELELNGEAVPINRFLFGKAFKDRVEGTATLDVQTPEVDNILAVSAARVSVSGSYAHEGKVVIEGIVAASVIYYNAEQGSKNSVQVELPYSLSFNEDAATDNISLLTSAAVGAAYAKIKRSNEIELSVEVNYYVDFMQTSGAYVIKEINLGSERAPVKSAIAIYVTRGGETLWEVAKALMSTPELILEQNPQLKVPLTSGERVLVYRRLQSV